MFPRQLKLVLVNTNRTFSTKPQSRLMALLRKSNEFWSSCITKIERPIINFFLNKEARYPPNTPQESVEQQSNNRKGNIPDESIIEKTNHRTEQYIDANEHENIKTSLTETGYKNMDKTQMTFNEKHVKKLQSKKTLKKSIDSERILSEADMARGEARKRKLRIDALKI
eukprot:GHVL01018188.1.p3 GENE.GHVL01018188.1~~GHVL01018188.1.p3  ORF type:complete len:169 (+),score=31.07 GHVL01018188.1:2229-2735(+)